MVLVFSFLSCNGALDPSHDSLNTYYSTSFEDENDLNGWEGILLAQLRNDAPPGYGDKSVLISGGCIIPHASLKLPPPGSILKVRVELYAKLLLNSGFCELYMGNDHHHSQFVSIKDTSWAYYRFDKAIIWPADSTMTINLNSGGFIAGAMLVDGLRVKIVD